MLYGATTGPKVISKVGVGAMINSMPMIVYTLTHSVSNLTFTCLLLYHALFNAGKPEFSSAVLMTKTCCNHKKVTCFKLLSQNVIDTIRSEFYTSKETEQTQMIIDYMGGHSRGDKTILYTVGGQEVCKSCFRMVYGLRRHRFSSIEKKYLRGVVISEHGRLGKGCLSDSTIRMISWMRMFIAKVGDRMPMKDDIHLPSCLTKADVYALAVDELSQGGLMYSCQKSTFYQVWQTQFPHVKITKVQFECWIIVPWWAVI